MAELFILDGDLDAHIFRRFGQGFVVMSSCRLKVAFEVRLFLMQTAVLLCCSWILGLVSSCVLWERLEAGSGDTMPLQVQTMVDFKVSLCFILEKATMREHDGTVQVASLREDHIRVLCRVIAQRRA